MESKLRTKDEIAQEYTSNAAILGDKVFTKVRLESEMETVKTKMAALIAERWEVEQHKETEKHTA
jgi:hypothetical protein